MSGAAAGITGDPAPARPLVSVILPVRQPDAAALSRCLTAFAALPNAACMELVVIHTGAFDIAALGSDTAPFARRRVVECATPGIYAAFNVGIDHASGRFLLFYGHDDIALPAMERALELLARHGDEHTLLACGVYVQGLGARFPSHLRQGIVFRNWGHQGIFYAAGLVGRHRYDLRYPLRADHRLNMALLADPSVRCLRLREIVSYFTRGGFSSRTIVDTHFDAEQAGIASREFGPAWGLAVSLLLPVVRMVRKLIRAAVGALAPVLRREGPGS